MKCTTILTTFLSASVTLARPIHIGEHIQPEAIYSIKSFALHKNDRTTINTISFDITSADGGMVDFTCSAYDSDLSHDTELFQSGKIYSCGENSLFSFSYSPNGDENVDDLVLWLKVNETETWKGSTTPADAVCRPGGNKVGAICVSPDQEDSYIEMRKSQDVTSDLEGQQRQQSVLAGHQDSKSV